MTTPEPILLPGKCQALIGLSLGSGTKYYEGNVINMIDEDRWFSNISLHQIQQEGLFKYTLQGPSSRVSDSLISSGA